MSTRILVLSDTHVGSVFALMPPKFNSSDDREVSLNAGQEHLWSCWEHLISAVSKEKIDVIVHNGDVIDGKQEAQRGTELCLPIHGDQAEAAEAALRPMFKACGNPPSYWVQGTEFHDQKNGRELEAVAKGLGAIPYNGLGTGKYSRD